MTLHTRIYRILMARNRATYYWLPSRFRLDARDYLWRQAGAIVAGGQGEEWLDRNTGRFDPLAGRKRA